MSIIKKPKKPDAADAFIAGAPDASQLAAQEKPTATGVMRGARRQIALTFPLPPSTRSTRRPNGLACRAQVI